MKFFFNFLLNIMINSKKNWIDKKLSKTKTQSERKLKKKSSINSNNK